MDAVNERLETLERQMQQLAAEKQAPSRHFHGWQRTGSVLVCVLILIGGALGPHLRQARAQAGTPALTLEQRVAQLEQRVVELQRANNIQLNQIASLRATVARLPESVHAQEKQLAAIEGRLRRVERTTARLPELLAAQGQRLQGVADKVVHLTREGDDLFITGANLHIVNGAGKTETM